MSDKQEAPITPLQYDDSVKFIHLNAHSSYSLTQAIPSIKNLAKTAKELGMPAVGVTDIDNFFGAVECDFDGISQGVQTIIGTQLAITLQSLSSKEHVERGHLTLLIQNDTGWHHGIKLCSEASLNSDEIHPAHLDLHHLLERNEGIICLTGSAREGYIGKLILADKIKEAEAELLKLKEAFGDRLYIDIQRHGMAEEKICEPYLLDWAYKHNIALVATNDPRYLKKEHNDAFEVHLCIGDGRTIADPDRQRYSEEHYFKSQEEMLELFADLPEATANTVEIAKRCAFKVHLGTYYMPEWLTEEGDTRDANQIMRDMSYQGLKERMEKFIYPLCETEEEKAAKKKEYDERLEYELGIIIRMGYPGYFIITSDFIKWSKENDIPVGPGRGSGAGSLVAWAMYITDIDPIPFDLYFERFLNPERVSLPDFDVDFCQSRRGEVIEYVRRKYSDPCVSKIVTFGTLKAKACIRDVGRVMGMPYPVVNRIAAFVPEGPGKFTIKSCMEDDSRFQEMYDDDEEVREVLDLAMQLEGSYRHTSLHAAGVIIADRQIDEICPLYKDARSDMPAVQFNMIHAECAGLVKFDFLGLQTLTVIKKAVDYIKARHPEKADFDIELIPWDDAPTFELLRAGHTIGVFQVESRGMRDFLVRMEPDKFQYLSDVVALYRPGPLETGMTDDFIECRHGRQKPKYPHPALEDVLGETFGVPVYQEQVMRMAQVMAGYTLGGADMLRRAMGKKKVSEMVKHREIFAEGSAKIHGVSREVSDKIFDMMETFAGYGFNKAHTVAYGWISYQTAFLKTHFFHEFIAANMTLDRGNSEKVLKFKNELDRAGVELLLPDINISGSEFQVEDYEEDGETKIGIRFALTAIKGSGEDNIAVIVKERQANGPFKDIYDFMERIPPKNMNKKQLEVLIKAGAFDKLHENRGELFNNMSVLMSHMQAVNEEKNSDQIGLFGMDDDAAAKIDRPAFTNANKWDEFKTLDMEAQAIGFFLSSHPLDPYKEELKAMPVLRTISQFMEIAEGQEKLQAQAKKAGERRKRPDPIKVACIITDKREVRTKKGDLMAILSIADLTGNDEVAIFPKDFARLDDKCQIGKAVFMEIELGLDGERLRVNMVDVSDLDGALNKDKRITMRMDSIDALDALKEAWDNQEKGDTKCELHYKVVGLGDVTIDLGEGISFGKRARSQLEAIAGINLQ